MYGSNAGTVAADICISNFNQYGGSNDWFLTIRRDELSLKCFRAIGPPAHNIAGPLAGIMMDQVLLHTGVLRVLDNSNARAYNFSNAWMWILWHENSKFMLVRPVRSYFCKF